MKAIRALSPQRQMSFPSPEYHSYATHPTYQYYDEQQFHSNAYSNGVEYAHHTLQYFPQHTSTADQYPHWSSHYENPQFPIYHSTQHHPHHDSQYPTQESLSPYQPSVERPPVKLSFSKRTLVNTMITLNGVPHFRISTADAAGATTNIIDARTGTDISTIKRRILHPDSVTFKNRYHGKSQKIKEWLIESEYREGMKWTIQMDNLTLTLLWDVSNRLLVFKDSDQAPTAWFDPATAAESYALYIKTGVENSWDIIVTAAINIVHKRLLDDKNLAVNEASAGWFMLQQASWN